MALIFPSAAHFSFGTLVWNCTAEKNPPLADLFIRPGIFAESMFEGETSLKDETFDEKVYALVSEIPRGKVATYGQIALMLGSPQNARRVGRALHFAPPGIPCHRVVNCAGRLAPGFARQRQLLAREGVKFTQSGNVDLKRFILKIGENPRPTHKERAE